MVSKRKVLLVNDFPEGRTAIEHTLFDFGFTDVDVAADVKTARKLIKSGKYDAGLIDVHLSGNLFDTRGAEGVELVELFRKKFPNSVVCLFGALDPKEYKSRLGGDVDFVRFGEELGEYISELEKRIVKRRKAKSLMRTNLGHVKRVLGERRWNSYSQIGWAMERAADDAERDAPKLGLHKALMQGGEPSKRVADSVFGEFLQGLRERAEGEKKRRPVRRRR